MTFEQWAISEFGAGVVISGQLRQAWDAAIAEAAMMCDEQAKEPECPERATYCADAIRMLSSNVELTGTPGGGGNR